MRKASIAYGVLAFILVLNIGLHFFSTDQMLKNVFLFLGTIYFIALTLTLRVMDEKIWAADPNSTYHKQENNFRIIFMIMLITKFMIKRMTNHEVINDILSLTTESFFYLCLLFYLVYRERVRALIDI